MRPRRSLLLLVPFLCTVYLTASGTGWSGHPAVEQFDVNAEELPGVLYLVRTRGELPAHPLVTVHGQKDGLFLVSMRDDDPMRLAQTGCGVFPLQQLRSEQTESVRRWETLSSPDPFVAWMVNQVNWPDLAARIQWLVDFGTRYSLASNHQAVAQAVGSQFSGFGLSPEYHSFEYSGSTLWNVLAIQTGTVYPDSFFIVCGHFDSISENPYSLAPGADDNGTGTAVVLTAADILSEHSFGYSIIYICFGGEEQGLKGSQAYAAWAASTGLGIAGVLNFDMLGYWEPGVEADLEVECNEASQWLAEAILNAADLYTETPYELHVYNGAWWGDHASFWAEGFYAVNHEEAWDWGDPDFNPYYHSTSDLLEYVGEDFMLGNARLGIAALATLAQPDGSGSADPSNGAVQPFHAVLRAGPNPFSCLASFDVSGMEQFDEAVIGVYDITGRRAALLEVPLSAGCGSCVWNAGERDGYGVFLARLDGSPGSEPVMLVRIP